MPKPIAIEVVNASTHNLKGINCRIPHGKVTVVTGLSGAGKSSLAFDTVYAEAQRRYVESMSTYARQFLEQMERPPIDEMHNILPAVALVARNSIKNARSTVGTITEVHDVLRLLYTYVGKVHCPNGHGPIQRWTPQEVADELLAGRAGESFFVVASLPHPGKNAYAKLKELVRQGYFRRLEDGEVVRMEASTRWLKAMDPLLLVLGRFKPGTTSTRLAAAVEEAYQLASGTVLAVSADGERRVYGRRLTCTACGASVPRPTPALFSFNSPLGACPTCQGYGRVIGVDPGRVVPDPTRTLEERPFAAWNTPAYEELYDQLFNACNAHGVPLDVPWEDLPKKDRKWIWSGGPPTTIDSFFAYLERRIYKMHVRVFLSRFRAYNTCEDCGGRRLKPESLAVRFKDLTLPEITALSIEQLREWLSAQRFSRPEQAAAGHLLEQLHERLDTLHRVGLNYLSLDRQSRTLSGGEAQRIQLASALGSGLTSTLYVLDEPTIGLHPRDSDRLLDLLRDLAQRGNTVLVVEHDPTIISGADHVIDLGPRAGEHGGEVVVEGSIDEILACEASATGEFLRRPPVRKKRLNQDLALSGPRIRVRGAREHNLKGFDVEIPLDSLVVVTGVSGSGKSTLVENVVHGTYQRSQGVVDVEPGECDELTGLDDLADIVLVDQRPLGRSSRSNPVTYVKAYDEIRKMFAKTDDAVRQGIEAGHFSFNRDRGRCPECKGTGIQEVDMQFMASVTVTCDVCQGRRFLPEVLAITVRGRNIFETLELTIDTALEVFEDRKGLCKKLRALVDVGLGYLHLGQPTSTLSGGEAQRLKLASFLDRRTLERRLFLFDEPTTGLHFADVDLLYATLRRLVDGGHGVVVVEHHLDFMARADWIVDLGPGGGDEGGELLYSGPVEPFLDQVTSPTAEELRRHLRWRRRKSTK
jgi:excinuclease ABC subunit A